MNNRKDCIYSGLKELPQLKIPEQHYKNGESLATDEAEVWKRVLQYRVAKYLKPKIILETHPGKNIGTRYFKAGSPSSKFITQTALVESTHKNNITKLIDVDPFGQPWDHIQLIMPEITTRSVLMVSNGEAFAVTRNLKKSQRFPTENFGKLLPLWVKSEFIIRLEFITGLKAMFFYAYPTTVRVILSNLQLPHRLWRGCPQWMWWLEKYAFVS